MSIEALKMALEALEVCEQSNYGRNWVWPDTAHPTAMANVKEAITAIREALAQPEQEPVAWGVDWGKAGDIACVSIIKRLPNDVIEVVAVEYAPYSYTSPPPQRKPLTDEEIKEIFLRELGDLAVRIPPGWRKVVNAIEAAHGIKGDA